MMQERVEYYTPKPIEALDRKLALVRIAFQGSFAQVVSGRDFTEDEACRVAGIFVFNELQMIQRLRKLSVNISAMGKEQPTEYDLKMMKLKAFLDFAMLGDYTDVKRHLSQADDQDKLIEQARGEPKNRDEIKASLIAFSNKLPASGLGFGTLLDSKKDSTILEELMRSNLHET